MSHLSPGLVPVYNSLTDKHLAGYFSNTRIRRHLQRAGLITRSGRIVPDKEYSHKLVQRAHQRHVRECLAQAIFHKVLEMERFHQIEIKRKLQEFSRRERVHKIKLERSKRYEEDVKRILSPRPPTGSRPAWKQQSVPERECSDSSQSASSSRPNTAPGKMQRPVRLKPIHSNSTTASLRHSSPYRIPESTQENNQRLSSTMEIKRRRHFTPKEVSTGTSTYCLPVINNFVTPVPPVANKNDRGVKVPMSSTIRGRRLRPTTGSTGPEDPPWLRSSVYQSRVRVNMVYFGKTVRLSNDLINTRDEVRLFQQHCGGENLCVYKGKLCQGEAFQFISRRHRGFPFSLTFYLNGLQVERLSSCCEFKHRRASRLGGRHGHFGFSSVEGASPCYKCIIAMGLDKKPTPPPKRVKGDQSQEKSATSLKDKLKMEADGTREDSVSAPEHERCQTPKMDTTVSEESAPTEGKVRDDYEEDFEADDEGPVEETTAKEEEIPSLSNETGKKKQEADISKGEDKQDNEEDRSCPGSSKSCSDEEDTYGETTENSEDDEKEETVKENDQAEGSVGASEKDEWKSASVNSFNVLDSAGDSTRIEISDTSIPGDNKEKLGDNLEEGKIVEDPGHEIKNEDVQENAKSVQEKLAEAILKESQYSSEPELSDTSTEEEEGLAEKAPEEEKKDEINCEDSSEVIEEQKECTKAEEQKDTELDQGDNTQEQAVSEVGEDTKALEDEARTDGAKSEEPVEAQLPVDGENVAQDEKIEDPFEGSESAEVFHIYEEKVEGAAKPDSQHKETQQRIKIKEEEESSVLELSEMADEAAVADIAEAEAAATRETVETKAGSSEEQEVLSCEEAPETDTGNMQADSEEAQLGAENSSRSPEECGDSTAGKTVDMHLETAKTQSSNDEINEETKQPSQAKKTEDDSQQENCKEESIKLNETAEKQSLTNLEKITQAEDKAEENNDESNVVESIKQSKTPSEGTECQEILNEENKDTITESDKDAEGKRAESEICLDEEPETKEDDEGQGYEEERESTKIVEEKHDEAQMSENLEKETVKETKTNEECENTTKNSVAEEREISEITEEPNKGQDGDLDTQEVKIEPDNTADSENISESKASDGNETHEPTPDVAAADPGERVAERESERGEIIAENEASSFAAEPEPQEDDENVPIAYEKRQTDKPDDEIEFPEIKEVVVESVGNAKKEEDGLTDRAAETGIPESNAKETDGSLVTHDEAANRDLQPETLGAEIQVERNGIEEEKEVQHGNKKFSLLRSNIEIAEVSHLGEVSSALAAANVEETAHQQQISKAESVNDEQLVKGENGDKAEEASMASEEAASVLLKPRVQNTKESENAVGKETTEDLAAEDNTEMVTNWIQMHQTSKYFETFVEPLEDLRNEVPDAQVSNPNGEGKESAELRRRQSPIKMGRISADEETEESRDEFENHPADGLLQESEETDEKIPETITETDRHDSMGYDKESQEPFKTEVEAFSSFFKAETDFDYESSEPKNSGPDPIMKQSATELSFNTDQSNSLNGRKDIDSISDSIGKYGHQITQMTNFTSNSADVGQEESNDEDVQTKMLEHRFSGETKDMELIEDIKHSLGKERLSTFSLFGPTSYPLKTTSGSDGGQ